MTIDVTDRQAEVFAFLEKYIDEKGYPPTRGEIAEHFGFKSLNAAQQHLDALVHKGAIRVDAGVARGIVLLARSARA